MADSAAAAGLFSPAVLSGMAAALLTAVLAGMGIGGGGLLVLYFAFFSSYSQQQAQGINLLCFLCSAGAALLFRFFCARTAGRRGKARQDGAAYRSGLAAGESLPREGAAGGIGRKLLLPFVIAAVLFALPGSFLALRLSSSLLRRCFGALMALAGAFTVLSPLWKFWKRRKNR